MRLLLINIVDPKTWSESDKGQKVKNQRERQQMALLLTKQVTSLLQRTKLNITVTCQFLHAKNSRHMLLGKPIATGFMTLLTTDLIDFLEPTMVIVGSRGLGKLKGILLGSTSHYLVQKSSVPVMVSRHMWTKADFRLLDAVYRDLYARLTLPTSDIHPESAWHRLVLRKQLVANRKMRLWMLPRTKTVVRLLARVKRSNDHFCNVVLHIPQ